MRLMAPNKANARLRRGLRPPLFQPALTLGESVLRVLFKQGEEGAAYTILPRYLYTDAARENPVTEPGDPVGGVTDLSGNGNHGAQETDADRVIYRTEQTAGGRTLHYLDQTDGQSIEAQLPDLGTDATIAYPYQDGVVIAQGLTVPGPRDLPGVDRIYDFIARDAALTAATKDRILRYLWRSRSDAPVGTLVDPGPIDLIGDAPATVKDYAGSNDGTNNGAKAAVVDGVAGLNFDGLSFVDVAGVQNTTTAFSSDTSAPFTVFFEVFITDRSTDMNVFAFSTSSGDEDIAPAIRSERWAFFSSGRTGDTGEGSHPILNQWLNMRMEWDGEIFRIFQNGDLAFEINPDGDGSWLSGMDDLRIGDRKTTPDAFPWKGGLRNISVWDRLFTSQEAESIEGANLAGDETDLTAYWPMADINDENDIEVWT